MSSGRLLEGVYPALVTPFASDGSVALDAVESLSHELLEAGCAGIVALGTTGESPALDADEQRAVVDTVARVCDQRGAQLIVGAGSNNTAKTIAAVEALAGTPALAATLIVVPYYVRPSEAGIIAHLQAVAAASPAPVVVYNIPIRTGRNLGAESMLTLARTPNIVGMKQAVGALDADTLEILAGAPHGFSVLGGDDAFFLPTVLMGGAGAISPPPTCARRASSPWSTAGSRARSKTVAPTPRRSCPWCRRASPSRTRRCSRACCTPRAGSPLPTCASRSSRRRVRRSTPRSRQWKPPDSRR